MPDPSRRAGPRCLPVAGLALALVLAPAAEARPGWGGHRVARARVAPVKRVGPVRTHPATVKAEPAAATAEKPPARERASAWTSADGERACFRGRRKLWQDGTGWIVKKVSVCP